MPHHYMTLPTGEVHQDIIRICAETMRMKFLEYSAENGHLELTESLDDLVSKVEDFRIENLRESQRW
ncbi:hypothetical protein D3C76_1649710 [compost metagenome]